MQPKRKQHKSRAPELITPAELARRRGVHKSTATRACRGVLSGAMVDNLVDASHPLTRKWLGSTDQEPTPTPGKKGKGPVPSREDFARLQFRKRQAEARKLEIANHERTGQLVEREFVSVHVLSLVERSHIQLLRDLPLQVVGRLYALGRSNASEEEGIKVIRDATTTILTVARDGVVKNLRKRPQQQRASEASN